MKKIICILFLFPALVFGQVKAFPSAQGGGSNVTGGRGGSIIHVTNLNDSGAGSLRAALTTTGPRIIVFDVSGIITFNSEVTMNASHGDVTVAGQTAPEGGITIAGDPINFSGAENMIWRYIRRRNGQYTGVADVLDHNGFRGDTSEVIFDHMSFSFNDDQAIALSSRNQELTDITIQRCLFGENATNVIFSFHNDFSSGNISMIANLFSNSPWRTPNLGGDGRFDLINQVIWNYRNRMTNIRGELTVDPEINEIGNYYDEGNNSGSQHNLRQNGTPTIYSFNNYETTLYSSPTPSTETRNLWRDRGLNSSNPPLLDASYFTTTQHTLLANTETPMNPADARTSVLADVGANRYLDDNGDVQTYIDTYDQGRIDDATDRVSRDALNKSWTQPTIPENTRPGSFDTDNDGMADVWETAEFGDLDETATGDFDSDGYNNIEEYFNQVDEVTSPVSEGIVLKSGRIKINGANAKIITNGWPIKHVLGIALFMFAWAIIKRIRWFIKQIK